MAAIAGGGGSTRVIGLISVAHFMSHVFNYCLPPLLPLLKEEFATSYAALGLAMTGFAVAFGLGQTPAGFLVDRIGARRVLLAGIFVQSAAIALIAVAETYLALLCLFTVAGLAHAVYHPADYAILSNTVARDRLGRAFSFHSFTGNAGTAAVPLIMVFLAAAVSWRAAFAIVGLSGLAVGVLVWLQGSAFAEGAAAARKARQAATAPTLRDSMVLLTSLPILLCFLFYVVMNMAFGGVRNFAAAALIDMSGLTLALANAALTGFLIGVSAGTLIGGFIADRWGSRLSTAAIGLLVAGGLNVLVGSVSMPVVLLVAVLTASGVARGTIQATRDLMVFSMTPQGQHGKVFAFVSTGGAVGAAVTPIVFGWILDLGDPRWVFWISGIMVIAGIATFAGLRRAAAP